MNAQAIEKIAQIIALGEFGYYGLHQLPEDQAVSIGETLTDSNHWDDGNWTDESCGGACAIRISSEDAEAIISAVTTLGRNACKIMDVPFKGYHSYDGDTLVLCGCDRVEYGNDIGEIIMPNAQALFVISK